MREAKTSNTEHRNRNAEQTDALSQLQSSMFDVLCRNLLIVAERQADISPPQRGWNCGVVKPCPERTTEPLVFPASLQDAVLFPESPATAWLANFHCRFATKIWFLQSTLNVPRFMGRCARKTADEVSSLYPKVYFENPLRNSQMLLVVTFFGTL